MPTLEELGVTVESPVETVLTTYSDEREPHASAVGIWKANNQNIKLKLFTKTKTFQNIQETKSGAINFLKDVETITKLGLAEIFPNKKKLQFESAKSVNAPRISGSDAFIEFKVNGTKRRTISDEIGKSEIAEITGLVTNIEGQKRLPRPFKRSEFFLIEAAIYASKALEARKKGNGKILKSKVEEIEYYQVKCDNVAPESNEAELISEILNYFKEDEGV